VRPRAHQRATRALSLCLLIAGAALLGRAGYLKAKGVLAEHLIRRAWAGTLITGRPQPPWPWADTHPVGRLQIPALGYDEVVLEDASPRNLAFGPARMMNAAAPGQAGNVVLAGHRTSWFRPLEHVRVGHVVVLSWRDAASGAERSQRYRVSGTYVIEPSDGRFFQPTGADVLTLITCYPFGRGPASRYRYVVRAHALAPGGRAPRRMTGRRERGPGFRERPDPRAFRSTSSGSRRRPA